MEAARVAADEAEKRAKRDAEDAWKQGRAAHFPSSSGGPSGAGVGEWEGKEAGEGDWDPSSELGGWHAQFAQAADVDVNFTADLEIAGVGPFLARHPLTVRFSTRPTALAPASSPSTATDRPGENDFIGLYKAGAATDIEAMQTSHLAVEYTDGRADGSVRISSLPSLPGPYVLRYAHESGKMVAETAPFDVVAAPAKAATQSVSAAVPAPAPATAPSSNAGASMPGEEVLAPVPVPAPVPAVSRPEPTHAPALSSLSDKTAAGKRSYRPPYLLEKLVRISTYQLYVPLPRYVRTSATDSPGSASTPSSSSSSGQPVVVLPEQWMPGVAVGGDTSLGSDSPPFFEIIFELPQLGASGVCAYDASAADAAAAASLPPKKLAKLPRDFFRLKLRLQHRVELGKCTMKLQGDHIAVRMPMYYGGAALTDRPASLITAEETLSLRRQGRKLACRECGVQLVRPEAAAQQVAGDTPSPSSTSMRAYVLPSEYWLEWSDYWMCHETQANIYIPSVDFGAQRGVVLIGETHMQVHPGDIRAEAVIVRPESVTAAPDGHDHGHTHERSFDDASPCTIECARCAAPLGTARFLLPPGLGADGTATILPVSGSGLPSLSPSDGWGAKLSPDSDPVLRLQKDRLTVPSDAEAAPRGGVASPGPRPRNALRHYGVCARVATDLVTASFARSQYKFLLVATDAGVAVDGGEDGSASSTSSYSRVRLLITMVNWNSSIRGNLDHRPWTDADADVSPPVTGAPAPASSTAATSLSQSASRWESWRDMPALQVRYRVVEQPVSGEDAEYISGWEGASPAQAVGLLEEECERVLATLAASTALLPPSARAHDGMALGYLPFLETRD